MISVGKMTVLYVFLPLTSGLRRIYEGETVTADMPFMVYFVRAETSPQHYDEWLCGGSLITMDFVLTAAACLEDVKRLYVISGTKRYVNTQDLNTDECAKRFKKKVVYTCIPKAYTFAYEEMQKWAAIDIGLAKLESPIALDDKSYLEHCDYSPATIGVNYASTYERVGLDVLVAGWGHTHVWRKPEDSKDYNQAQLQYASTLIMPKKVCKDQYINNPRIVQIIDTYMICTDKKGNIDERGNIIQKDKGGLLEGCIKSENGACIRRRSNTETEDQTPLNNTSNISTTVKDTNTSFSSGTSPDNLHLQQISLESYFEVNSSQNASDEIRQSRRGGICQNDHGGPLLAWVGSKLSVIGVASAFIVKDGLCQGPFLFTSTHCNSAFIDCLIHDELIRRSNPICSEPPVTRGFDMMERFISWANHPDGPADNEAPLEPESLEEQIYTTTPYTKAIDYENEGTPLELRMRPMIPLSAYQ